jgi:hypothetical protein
MWRLALSISDGRTWLSDQAPGFGTSSGKKVQSGFVIAKDFVWVDKVRRWDLLGGGRDWYAI